MSEYNRSEIVKQAWSLARATAEKHGGKARDYYGAALSEIWRMAKEVDEIKKVAKPISTTYTYTAAVEPAQYVGVTKRYTMRC